MEGASWSNLPLSSDQASEAATFTWHAMYFRMYVGFEYVLGNPVVILNIMVLMTMFFIVHGTPLGNMVRFNWYHELLLDTGGSKLVPNELAPFDVPP